MLGNATDSAVTIAILWIVGGYLMTITGWGVSAFIVKLIVERVYTVYNCEVKRGDHQDVVNQLEGEKQKNSLLWDRHNEKQDTLRAEHKIELEKIKHLYKILKESKDV